MPAYIDEAYIENAIGVHVEEALSDASSEVRDQLIAAASAVAQSALLNAGYTVDPDDVPDLVRHATLAALLPMLYGRKGLRVPEELAIYGATFEAIREGHLPVPGLAPDAGDAVGGVEFSESDASVTGSKPKVFGGLRKLV